MLTWRNVLIACVLSGYLAWSANQLWHDSNDKPADEPAEVPFLVEMV